MTINVLFLCPHGAAKSVLAMTYFKDLAHKEGLDVMVKNGGTEPDPAINRKVEAHLKTEGYDLTGFVPPLLTPLQLDWADYIVSIGCISAEDAPHTARFLDWSDVPMLSDNFQASRAKILEHVTALVEEVG